MSDYLEVRMQLEDLSDYYSEVLGADVQAGLQQGELWLSCARTNGREYFEDIEMLEDRIKMLYHDRLLDEDYRDPLEGWI